MATSHLATVLLLCGVFTTKVDGAVLYTRWGRQTCGSIEAELVYTGYVAGSSSGHTGGASNYMCLPRSPTFGNHDSALYDRAYIYGAEYRFNSIPGNFPYDVPEETDLRGRNALCAVCAVHNASLVLMIPGRVDCYPGWTMEYTGYLVTQKYDLLTRTEFVCLDKSPEPAVSDDGLEEGAYFFAVEGICGTLPCPPYENGWELACVVCTKRHE